MTAKSKSATERTRLLDIASGYGAPQHGALLAHYKTEEGAKITTKGDLTYFTMAKLKAKSTAGEVMAMNNWLSAARRELMGAQ